MAKKAYPICHKFTFSSKIGISYSEVCQNGLQPSHGISSDLVVVFRGCHFPTVIT